MRDPELEMQIDELCTLETNRNPTEDELLDIYLWIDSLQFSRPKRNINRDFSDGVLMAELIFAYFPRLIDLGQYFQALSKRNKLNNWEHLNSKVFSKIGYKIDKKAMNDIIENKPGAIEKIMFDLRPLIARKNRSILNYRIGRNPEVFEAETRVPYNPTAMTVSTEGKRRSKSVQPTRLRKSSPIASQPVTAKPPINPPTRQRSTTHLQEKLTKPLATKIPVGDSNPPSIVIEETIAPTRSRSTSKSRVPQKLSEPEIIIVSNTETKFQGEEGITGVEPWSPSVEVSHENLVETVKTAALNSVFGEELLLNGNASTPRSVEESKENNGNFVDGIPGIRLGFYGLV